MRAVTTSFLLLAFAGGAQAQAELANARQCWNLLPTEIGIGASVDLAVSLKDGVVTSIEVTGYKPDTDVGYRIATTAQSAVEGCGPYGDFTGDVVVTFDADAEAENPVSKPVPLPGQQ